MLATRIDMVGGAQRPDRPPATSPLRNGRARGSRMRCLPGSIERTWAACLDSLVAAAVLAVCQLALPATPASAAGETCKGIDHREAACPSELPTAWIRDSNVTQDGLRIGRWQSLEEGKPAGTADIDRRRWRDWTWGSFARLADDGPARTGARAMTGRDLLLGSSFPSTAGDSANPDARWSRRGQAAPTRLAGAHGTSGDARIGLSGADCARGHLLPGVTLTESDRDGIAGPVRHWRTAIGTSLAPPGRERASWTAQEPDGCTIPLKWDAFGMRTAAGTLSDTSTGNPASAHAGRVGLLPEGSRRFDNRPSRIRTLSLEAGILRDGGDARSVASVEMESAPGSGTH